MTATCQKDDKRRREGQKSSPLLRFSYDPSDKWLSSMLNRLDLASAEASRHDPVEYRVELGGAERLREQRDVRGVGEGLKLRVEDVAADEHEPIEHVGLLAAKV